MSVQEEITRLKTAKTRIVSILTDNDQTVPAGATLDAIAEIVETTLSRLNQGLPAIISFRFSHMGGTDTYQAEEGMTWGEWLESDYVESGFYADLENGWIICPQEGGRPVSYMGNVVAPNDEIVANGFYTYN